jgi:hypothetical protein
MWDMSGEDGVRCGLCLGRVGLDVGYVWGGWG